MNVELIGNLLRSHLPIYKSLSDRYMLGAKILPESLRRWSVSTKTAFSSCSPHMVVGTQSRKDLQLVSYIWETQIVLGEEYHIVLLLTLRLHLTLHLQLRRQTSTLYPNQRETKPMILIEYMWLHLQDERQQSLLALSWQGITKKYFPIGQTQEYFPSLWILRRWSNR